MTEFNRAIIEQRAQTYRRETLDESRRALSEQFRVIIDRSRRWATNDDVSKFAILMPGFNECFRRDIEHQICSEAAMENRGAVWLTPCIDGRYDIGFKPLWLLSETQERDLSDLLPAFLTRRDPEGVWRIEGLSRTDALLLTQDVSQFCWLCDQQAAGVEVPDEEWRYCLPRGWSPLLFA